MGKRRKCRDKANCFRKLELLEKTLAGMTAKLERSRFLEYVEYVGDEKLMLRRAFRLGLLRGAGTAIGFTILGAVAVYLLRLAAASNLPYIADFISRIIEIIEKRG
jgi:hypothetical protein